jgi:hypothetical protein
MKCKNCGFQKDAHIQAPAAGGRTAWECPNGSGETFPVTPDVKVELHYRAGETHPWIAKCITPTADGWEVVAEQPAEALALAGREIEASLEEKTNEEKNVEKAIEETRHRGSH